MNKPAKKLLVHFMGIGGSGISGIARMAREFGYEVTGCDLEEGPITTRLRREGVPVEIGHSATHLSRVDLLVHTTAVFYQSEHNPEFRRASQKKMALTWEEFMAKYLMKDKFVIAISGTHGKGTTTAMLSYVLEKAGMDPTCEVGANLLDWGRKNFRVGKSKYFICEADEFRDKFLLYHPNLLVVTAIEMDHPEYFKNQGQIIKSFLKLVKQMKIPRVLVINEADQGCRDLLKAMKKARWSGKVVKFRALSRREVKLRLPGEHIRSDAGAVFAAARELSVKALEIKKGLEKFSGLERRFEYRGQREGVVMYDDYAHHPTAIMVNVSGARELYPKRRILVVFQPHMFSRLSALFDEFAKALRAADRVVVSDVYTRREHGVTKPTGKELANAIGKSATYVGGDLSNVANFVERNMRKGDVALVMGAGDIYRVSDWLLARK